ncbi:hypothetical protein B0H13DRAFT_2542726 [Mycena leptocephala]|nr:hypothetical protein B0H13DRAFT_2542726 [Mycena leptocephala]
MQMVTKTRAAVDDIQGDEATKKAVVDAIKHSEELELRAQTLRSTVEELRERTKDLKGGPGLFGPLKGFIYSSRNAATLSDMKDSLARAIRIFKLRGQMSIENVLSGVINDVKQIRKNLKEAGEDNDLRSLRFFAHPKPVAAEEQTVLSSIPRADAGYRCVDELKSEFLGGTRKKLFEELALWSAGDFPSNDPKQLYFLSGGAGLGKSSIAHQFCTRLDVPGKPPSAVHFFSSAVAES